MSKAILKTPTAIIVGMAMLTAASCTDSNDPTPAGGVSSDDLMPIVFKGLPRLNAATTNAERLSEVTVFHFNGDKFLMCSEIEDPYAESIVLPADGTTDIFCVSGTEIETTGMTTATEFDRCVVVSPANADSAPLFYTGKAAINEESISGGQLNVEMKRSVARIDFANDGNPDLKVTEVTVENAPAASYVFEKGNMADAGTVSYTKTFGNGLRDSETGIFTIFESSKPVKIRVIGEYKDSPLNVEAVLPKAERNKIYTLQIFNVESKTEGTFTVKDWETGCDVEAAPDAGSGIYINTSRSEIPAGVEVDYQSNKVSVPATGVANMKLAFLSTGKVSVSMVEGLSKSVAVTPNEPEKVETGYLSSFNVTVAPQPNGAIAYGVIIHLKDDSGKYNFVEISVPGYHYIETVEMAGLTWMAFNAVSDDPENQVFPFDGISVEEMYRQNWSISIGNFFQYGRKKGYSPWTRNDPNGNEDTPRNIPWSDPACMPAPEGYHVASAAEWQKLLPNGTTIPSAYTAANGERINVEVIELPGTLKDSPSAAANKANLKMRYVRFESLDTHNVLIIPVCAMKTPSTDEYPGGGRALHDWAGYWIADDRCLWLFQVAGDNGSLTATQSSSKWSYNGFMPVRCIKNQ